MTDGTAGSELVKASAELAARGPTTLAPRSKSGGWLRRTLAKTLPALAPGLLGVGTLFALELFGIRGDVIEMVLCAGGLGIGAAARRGLQRRFEYELGIESGESDGPDDQRAQDELPVRVGAIATAGAGTLGALYVLISALKALAVSPIVGLPLGIATLALAPIAIHDTALRALRPTLRVLGLSQPKAKALPAPPTRLIGVATELHTTVRAPLSGGACLVATAVAVDVASDGELGHATTQSELGLRVGDNLFVVSGTMRVGGERCESIIPAAGTRSQGLVAGLAAAHPRSELREYVVRAGDRIEVHGPPLLTEAHPAFEGNYRSFAEGPILRGTKDSPLVVTRL